MNKKIPQHIVEVFGSARKFRSHHRKQLQRLRLALNEARRGCAYAPSYRQILQMDTALKTAIEATSVANWEGKP